MTPPPNKTLQRTAAPLGSRTFRENLFATVAAGRAFPAAVAQLGRYNAQDTQYFDIIASGFDSHVGVVHGLVHKQLKEQNGMCPACMSQRFARNE